MLFSRRRRYRPGARFPGPADFGQLNRPPSKRFAITQRPLPSQCSIFTLVRVLFVNTNIAPLNGLSFRCTETCACRPLKPLRMSTGSSARYIFDSSVMIFSIRSYYRIGAPEIAGQVWGAYVQSLWRWKNRSESLTSSSPNSLSCSV